MADTFPSLLSSLLDKAKAAGATAADALVHESTSESVSVRLGKVEEVERSENQDLGLRVLVGQRQACVSTNDFTPSGLTDLAERAVAMAKQAPEDPYCGLAPSALLAQGPFPDLDLWDGQSPISDTLKERALACEEAALAIKGVTNSSGAGASVGHGRTFIATSTGFFGDRSGGHHSLSVSVLAGEGTAMERDYDYDSKTHLDMMRAPGAIGRRAGERAVRRLNPTKMKSQRLPVIFDQRLSAGLLGPLAGAINGGAIARGTSFLKDKMGEALFPADVTITDDPFIRRGFGSRPFDGEGVAPEKLDVIKDGVLTAWILNCRQARQLGLETNGRAKRGTGAPPGSGTTNFDLPAGPLTPEALYHETGDGLLVTETFGPQINSNTGDYSVGCSGYRIEKGEITAPVSEITIAGNLLEMWRNLSRANDFERRGGMNAPTLRVGEMTIAGN